MIRGIVVFEMSIQTIQGKCKLSQNRSIADQRGAVSGLRANGDSESLTLAEFAEEYLHLADAEAQDKTNAGVAGD